MAGSDSHRQFLALIRDYSTEKAQGERRIVNGRKRIEELISELDASNKELDKAKRDKEAAEQALRGYEVELSMNEASIQALEARIAVTNDEISKHGAATSILMGEESSLRDSFIAKMLELNAHIRKFQVMLASVVNADNCSEARLDGGVHDAQQTRLFLESKLAKLISQTNEEEQQYESEKLINDQSVGSSSILFLDWK
ncbi:uncharacterized protein LOC127244468 isoform X2 [Andrographis paniculata]|uniref:uncharacterized protein LOC127244468 isoform X2 n=1 Tax=Andrographis paniculata TaxID=175694 RepID=UPI0021E74BBF|nr:uncharacterized protein LOC127244468 isoform X2 [Andrographis paniculata]